MARFLQKRLDHHQMTVTKVECFINVRCLKVILLVSIWINLIALWLLTQTNLAGTTNNTRFANKPQPSEDSLIIVITPTHYRLEQMADLTRFSQTLRLISKLHWIVVEDSSHKSATIEKLLNRSNLNFTHLTFDSKATNATKKLGRGWAPRNFALNHLRSLYATDLNPNAVVYFADDDNSYDIRLFNDYIRHVKRVGVWAVALVGYALVEAPRVSNKIVVGWNVQFGKNRTFAVDMAGFAVHMQLILSSHAVFDERCLKSVLETCFLEQLNITWNQLQPFGCDGEQKEILVWHTKTYSSGKDGPNWGYVGV